MKYIFFLSISLMYLLGSCTKNVDAPAGSGNKVTVSTSTVSSITTTSAVCGGTVSTGGADTISTRGVCWAKTINPTTSNFKTANGSGVGAYTSNLTGLTNNTTYYIRAYATSVNGTFYGVQRSFRTN